VQKISNAQTTIVVKVKVQTSSKGSKQSPEIEGGEESDWPVAFPLLKYIRTYL